MILQAFIDDSKTNARRSHRVFMLSGLVSTVEKWAEFSNEWVAKLNEHPKLDYFKLSEALSMRDEFDRKKGWTERLRDQRLLDLATIARRHAFLRIGVALSQSLYDDFVKPYAARFKDLQDPYFLCFFQVVDAITQARGFFLEATSLAYIFDEQGEIGTRSVNYWQQMKAILPWRSAELLGSTPVHRDDKIFRPLQAADLYAGLERIKAERGDQMGRAAQSALEIFWDLEVAQRTYTKGDLMELGADLVIRNVARRERGLREG